MKTILLKYFNIDSFIYKKTHLLRAISLYFFVLFLLDKNTTEEILAFGCFAFLYLTIVYISDYFNSEFFSNERHKDYKNFDLFFEKKSRFSIFVHILLFSVVICFFVIDLILWSVLPFLNWLIIIALTWFATILHDISKK